MGVQDTLNAQCRTPAMCINQGSGEINAGVTWDELAFYLGASSNAPSAARLHANAEIGVRLKGY